jgi:Phospholipase_D-nuclease N-terminal
VSDFLWVFVGIPLLIVWVVGIVDIVRRDLPAGLKAGWIMVVLLLPFLGTLVYFIMRKPTPEEIRVTEQARRPPR